MEEAILGLDAEDAREARARRSWQVQNCSVYFRHWFGFGLVPSEQAQWFGVVYFWDMDWYGEAFPAFSQG